jgi:ABC-type nitrate/sulfonate/bicarbonate transport system permease component
MKRFMFSALFFIALLSIWHLLVLAKIWSPVLLPDPISVWEYFKGAAADGTLVEASLVTMRRLLAGYVIGIAAGLPFGLLTATVQVLRRHNRGACTWLADAAEHLLGAAGAALVRANGNSDAFRRHHGHTLVGDHRD